MLTLIRDFLGGKRCFPGNSTSVPFGCLRSAASLAHSIPPGPERGPCPGTVLPLSHTDLAQLGLVIGNVALVGGHDDPACESLLAKSLCTHQGSHTCKRCSSQPSDTSLRRRRRRRSRSVLPGEERRGAAPSSQLHMDMCPMSTHGAELRSIH